MPQPYNTPKKCPRCNKLISRFDAFCGSCSFDLKHGTISKIEKGECIYCGEEEKYTQEHVLGKWMVEEFGKGFTTTDHLLTRPIIDSGNENKKSIQSHAKRKKENPFNIQIPNVCAACNNGWMSQLHTLLKPTVIDLANALPVSLCNIQRKNLALWISMISINLQCYGRQLYTSQEHRKKFMKGEIPDGWKFFIGTMKNSFNSSRTVNRSLSLKYKNGDSEITKPMVVNYFIVGRAIFCTMSSLDYQTLIDATSKIPGGFKMPLKEIWPNHVMVENSNQTSIDIEQADSIVEQFDQLLEKIPSTPVKSPWKRTFTDLNNSINN